MRPRHADTLKELGFTGPVEEFRAALIEIKAEHFPDFTIDELTYTRDEAGTYCALVRKRLGAPRLTRPFILRSLVGLRKARKARTAGAEIAQTSGGVALEGRRDSVLAPSARTTKLACQR